MLAIGSSRAARAAGRNAATSIAITRISTATANATGSIGLSSFAARSLPLSGRETMTTLTRRSALKALASASGLLLPAVATASPASQRSGLRFELYRDPSGEFRWRLRAGNGRIVATSGEGYNTKANCRNAIDLVRNGARTARIEDQR